MNLNVDVAIVYELQEVVLLDDFVGDEMERDFHVFVFRWIVHRSAKVEVLDVHAGGLGVVG